MKSEQWRAQGPSRTVLPQKKNICKFGINMLSPFPCGVLSVLIIFVNDKHLKLFCSPSWFSVLCFFFFLFSYPGHPTLVVRVMLSTVSCRELFQKLQILPLTFQYFFFLTRVCSEKYRIC